MELQPDSSSGQVQVEPRLPSLLPPHLPSQPYYSVYCFTFSVAWLELYAATWPQGASCSGVNATANHPTIFVAPVP